MLRVAYFFLQVANLVEMVEDLAVASNDVEFDEDDENEPQHCLVKSIV